MPLSQEDIDGRATRHQPLRERERSGAWPWILVLLGAGAVYYLFTGRLRP